MRPHFFFLGPAADKFNLPNIALTGTILLAVIIIFASYAQSFRLFIVAMAMIGFCAALIPASMFPHITRISPQDKIGLYVGAVVACGTLGVIFGRVTMGILTSMLGWRISFQIFALILIVLSVITFFSLVDKRDNEIRNDQNLLKLYANSMSLMISPKIISLLLAGFTLFFGFLGMVTFLTYRLIAPPFNFSSGEVGWISFAGISAIIAPFAGNLSQKIGAYKLILPGLVVCLVAFQLMGWFQSIPFVLAALLLLFLGVYVCQPLLFLLIGQNAPKQSLGSASSLYILFCIGGGSLSSILLGPVWQSHGWVGITVICTISLLASLIIMTIIAFKENSRRLT